MCHLHFYTHRINHWDNNNVIHEIRSLDAKDGLNSFTTKPPICCVNNVVFILFKTYFI